MTATDRAIAPVELLPCPFCGGEAYDVPDNQREWAIQCQNCSASVVAEHVGGVHAQTAAFTTWNARHMPSAAAEGELREALDTIRKAVAKAAWPSTRLVDEAMGTIGNVLAALSRATPTAGESYASAFYDLASMMGLPAQPLSPAQVWAEQMRPRLAALLATPPASEPASAGEVDWAKVGREYAQAAINGQWPGITAPHYALSGAFDAMAAEIERLRLATLPPTAGPQEGVA